MLKFKEKFSQNFFFSSFGKIIRFLLKSLKNGKNLILYAIYNVKNFVVIVVIIIVIFVIGIYLSSLRQCFFNF